jgi:hypothetical protein
VHTTASERVRPSEDALNAGGREAADADDIAEEELK